MGFMNNTNNLRSNVECYSCMSIGFIHQYHIANSMAIAMTHIWKLKATQIGHACKMLSDLQCKRQMHAIFNMIEAIHVANFVNLLSKWSNGSGDHWHYEQMRFNFSLQYCLCCVSRYLSSAISPSFTCACV